MPSTPRRAAIAVAAVLTAVTLVACSSGDAPETPSPSGAPSSSTHQEAKPRLSTQRRNVPRCRTSPARR